MNNKSLLAKVATLESQVDHLEAEITYVHKMLVDFGFEQGIESLKGSLEEALSY